MTNTSPVCTLNDTSRKIVRVPKRCATPSTRMIGSAVTG